MRHQGAKKVKIVATLGPASDSQKMIEELIEEGVNVFRINLSHNQREEVIGKVKRIRAAEKKLGIPTAIMGDLMGPKIRIGEVTGGTELVAGQTIKIVAKPVLGTAACISLNFPTILKSVHPGTEIFLGDGLIQLLVEKVAHGEVVARVIVGGLLGSRKGFTAQGITLKRHGLTAKDRADIKIMREVAADALAISFVQTPADVKAVRELLGEDYNPILIAKIETMTGVKNAEDILGVADGLMVARGDLGLAVPIAEVPHIQKRLISLCLRNAKPVITATQMLSSMVTAPIPTRAEVADVANAILDGTDAVMLSDETAMGTSPVRTVRTMTQIIERAVKGVTRKSFPDANLIADAISSSVVRVADQIGSRLIVVLSEKGVTARRVSRHRPAQIIVALSPNMWAIRRMNFTWGVFGYLLPNTKHFDNLVAQTKRVVAKVDVIKLKKGESFVVSAGVPFGRSGTTNLVLVERL